MKKHLILAAGGLAALALAGPASAFVFTPPATSFAGGGPFSVATGGAILSCSARYKLKTNPTGSQLRFLGVQFFGPGACPALSAQGLPWVAVKTPNNTTVKIIGMHLTGAATCGPNNVPNGSLSASTLSYSSAALSPCTLTFSISISPTIS